MGAAGETRTTLQTTHDSRDGIFKHLSLSFSVCFIELTAAARYAHS